VVAVVILLVQVAGHLAQVLGLQEAAAQVAGLLDLHQEEDQEVVVQEEDQEVAEEEINNI